MLDSGEVHWPLRAAYLVSAVRYCPMGIEFIKNLTNCLLVLVHLTICYNAFCLQLRKKNVIEVIYK